MATSVFLSYAWESDAHKEWVAQLADSMQAQGAFNVVFDQYDLHAGKDLTHFMDNATQADRIVVVITPAYVEKAESRMGGVGYEAAIISAHLLRDQLSAKVVPALRRGDVLPPFLGSKVYVDFRRDAFLPQKLEELFSAIRGESTRRRPAQRAERDYESYDNLHEVGVEVTRLLADVPASVILSRTAVHFVGPPLLRKMAALSGGETAFAHYTDNARHLLIDYTYALQRTTERIFAIRHKSDNALTKYFARRIMGVLDEIRQIISQNAPRWLDGLRIHMLEKHELTSSDEFKRLAELERTLAETTQEMNTVALELGQS